MKKLTIVTVTYNSSAVIGRLLASLSPPGAGIVVVDNGSLDGSQAIARGFPGVQVMECGNIGYGRAANVGFRQVKTPYVLLVNPDVEIAWDSVEQMVACMDADPGLGIVGANMDGAPGEGFRPVEWIVGALMLIRMEALAKVGMFDENIFLFYEETDLCRRFVQAGWKLGVLQSARAEHEAGTSSPSSLKVLKIKAWHSAWSKIYYTRKHFARGRMAHKAVSKIATNLMRICKGLLTADFRWVVKNFYELLGVLAYMTGMGAFKNGVGRLT